MLLSYLFDQMGKKMILKNFAIFSAKYLHLAVFGTRIKMIQSNNLMEDECGKNFKISQKQKLFPIGQINCSKSSFVLYQLLSSPV